MERDKELLVVEKVALENNCDGSQEKRKENLSSWHIYDIRHTVEPDAEMSLNSLWPSTKRDYRRL